MMSCIQLHSKADCCGCGVCAEVCSKNCLSIKKDEYGFNFIDMRDESCVDCGRCLSLCPQQNVRENSRFAGTVYCAQNKDLNIAANSTSGGIFTLLAEEVISHGGAVWGVAWSSENLPEFVCIADMGELDRLRGSKYVEVDAPMPYQDIKKQVDSGKLVLVSGLPCQILALCNFLGQKKYNNLILVDLYCYGVQAPAMWKKYLSEVNPEGREINSVSFRYKNPSWENYSMKIEYADGTGYMKSRWKDPYLLSYATGMYNRESCTVCQSKKIPSVSDITLGDFWAIQWYSNAPKIFERKKGISILLVNSNKGEKIFESVKKNLYFSEIDLKTFWTLQPQLGASNKSNPGKRTFEDLVESDGFEKAVYSTLEHGIKKRFKSSYSALKIKIKLCIKGQIKKGIKR